MNLSPIVLFVCNRPWHTRQTVEALQKNDKYGRFKRYKRINGVRFLDYIFDVPDLPSFLWQFKEIFVNEIYNFEPKTNKPLIYDCGANIGISVLYFKQLFPKAKIKAFEADQIIVDILKNNLFKKIFKMF